MIDSFVRALAQLGDPRLRRVLWLSLAAGLAISLGLAAGTGVLLATVRLASPGWLEAVLDIFGGLAAAVLAILLFPALAGMVAGLFQERVADAVEARHYPRLGPPRTQSAREALGVAFRFAALLVALNLLALPLYAVPGIGTMVYLALNGYLLGREYFAFAALRRLAPTGARALYRQHAVQVFLAGLGLAVLAALPLLNFVLPVVGTSVMVHRAAGLQAGA